jgi:hypothetical protein
VTAIERLRALEKAVELVAKAEDGAWMVDRAAPPCETTGVSTEYRKAICEIEYGGGFGSKTNGVEWLTNQAEAIVAAVNFIREHGSALIAELGQDAGAVADALTLSAPPKVWLQVDTDALEDSEREPIAREHWDQLTWCAESVGGHEVIYIREALATSPAHTSEARDAARLDWLDGFTADSGYRIEELFGSAGSKRYVTIYTRDGDALAESDNLREAIDAAMRQEGGNG